MFNYPKIYNKKMKLIKFRIYTHNFLFEENQTQQ